MSSSVSDRDPEPDLDLEGSETIGLIWIQYGSEIIISDPNLNPDLKPDKKQICKKEPCIQAKIR